MNRVMFWQSLRRIISQDIVTDLFGKFYYRICAINEKKTALMITCLTRRSLRRENTIDRHVESEIKGTRV